MADRTKRRTTDFGEMLKFLRQKENMTQALLAQVVHKAESTIRSWENEGVEPDLQTINMLASIFKVPVGLLMNDPCTYTVSEDEIENDFREDIQNERSEAGRRYLRWKHTKPIYDEKAEEAHLENELIRMYRELPSDLKVKVLQQTANYYGEAQKKKTEII